MEQRARAAEEEAKQLKCLLEEARKRPGAAGRSFLQTFRQPVCGCINTDVGDYYPMLKSIV